MVNNKLKLVGFEFFGLNLLKKLQPIGFARLWIEGYFEWEIADID